MPTFLLFLYLIPLFFIFTYSIIQFLLIINYLKSKKRKVVIPALPEALPFVTIQLPIYNEKYVVERLIESVAAIRYPTENLEVQLLDDSTDETSLLISAKLKELSLAHFQHIRRPNREGFKAGALAYGLQQAKGEFIAIFDADFLPDSQFLLQTIPHFQDNRVGVVQTRWTHLNENESLLTQLQAFGLDAHFFIEQGGRNAAQHYINFNGTAGVWRKTTILDSGGWEADTLTEDLDLSYRAQMRGWQFVYREDIESPAELPVAINAIKSQQYRWMKGGAECFIKNGLWLLKAPNVRLSDKFHGFFHLLNSSVFTAVFFLALLSIPLFFVSFKQSLLFDFYRYTAFFQVNWLILGVFYWISFRYKGKNVFTFFYRFFWFLTFMMGLSLHNSIAVVEGWVGRQTPFVRTPKFGKDNWKTNTYVSQNIGIISWIELALALIFGSMFCLDALFANYGMLVFHGMLAIGFGSIFGWTIKHIQESRNAKT